MPTAPASELLMRKAARKAPATIRKQPKKHKHFHAWTVSQLLETYRDPRAVLLEIASTPTDELAKTLNCTLLDAVQERRLAATIVLPYVSQRLP